VELTRVQKIRTGLRKLPPFAPDRDPISYRLMILSSAVLGGSIGTSIYLIASLVYYYQKWTYPYLPNHLYFMEAIIQGLPAFIIGGGIATLFALMSAPSTIASRNPFNQLLKWIFVGFSFAIIAPFFSGYFAPLADVTYDLQRGAISSADFSTGIGNAFAKGVHAAFQNATFGLFTSLLGGLIWGLAMFAIDTANNFTNLIISRYYPIIFALILS
ncbi:uncharacterized protein METZ01_LOCUS340154, partial [marine metagenome]